MEILSYEDNIHAAKVYGEPCLVMSMFRQVEGMQYNRHLPGRGAGLLIYIQPSSTRRLNMIEMSCRGKGAAWGCSKDAPANQLARKGKARPSLDFVRIFFITCLSIG